MQARLSLGNGVPEGAEDSAPRLLSAGPHRLGLWAAVLQGALAPILSNLKRPSRERGAPMTAATAAAAAAAIQIAQYAPQGSLQGGACSCLLAPLLCS